MVPIGRAFYSLTEPHRLHGGKQLCWGNYQTVVFGEEKLLLNLDQTAAVFYSPGPLLDLVLANVREHELRNLRLLDRDVQSITRMLTKIEVVPTHRVSAVKKTIVGVSRRPASATMFEVDGEQVSVVQYFASRYSMRLRYSNLPPVNVGSTFRPVWLPIEICKVAPGQRCPGVSEAETTEILKKTAKRPDCRASQIMELASRARVEDDPTLTTFGVTINAEMEQLDARVIDAPEVQFATTSKRPTMGTWTLRGHQFVDGAMLRNWGVVVHAGLQETELQRILEAFRSAASRSAMTVESMDAIPIIRQVAAPDERPFEELMRQCFSKLEVRDRGPPQLLLVIVKAKSPPLFASIKRTAQTVLGVPSQCLLSTEAAKCKEPYFASVCSKVNMKLDGRNWILRDDLPLVSSSPTIVIGAHIHQPVQGGSSRPSIAAVTASIDRYSAKYVARVAPQPSTRSDIRGLTQMVREVLLEFYRVTQRKPAHIVYFRDRVDEKQFDFVLQREMQALRRACLEICDDFQPPVTFITASTQHHMRSFCVDRGDADRSGNVPPGTVVNSLVVDRRRFDFFLYSHSGNQGTSRPVHYTVLRDENNLSAADIQKLTYFLCYTYARSARSVSMVSPVYYAELAATRAGMYLTESADGTASTGIRHSDSSSFAFAPLHENLRSCMYFV